MFFDARKAKQLQPGDHLVIDGCPGLRLEASETRRTWTYRYKASDGRRMKQTAMGQWPVMTAQAAVAEWDRLRSIRAAGGDPGQLKRDAKQTLQGKRGDPATYTVRSVVQDYIKGHLKVSRKEAGALAAERFLDRFLTDWPALADRPASTVTRTEAFDVIDGLKGYPTVAAKVRSMLGSAWDMALDAGTIAPDSPNWWRMIMKGRLKSKGKVVGGKHVGRTRRTLPAAEIGQLLAWLPNMHALGRDTAAMYLWTCARGVEILGMRPEHVGEESDGWWWTVPKAMTKNARHEHAVDLRVPLIGRALEIVRRRCKAVGKSGLLFEDVRGEQYTQHDFSTYIYSLQPYSAKAERRQGEGLVLPVTGWTPHNLRRSARTLLAGMGCSNDIGEAILGHMPAEIVATYNEYTYDVERRTWLGKLAKRLEQLHRQALRSS